MIRKHNESELSLVERRNAKTKLIGEMFKEIGREQSFWMVQDDLRKGKRASVRVVDPKVIQAMQK